MNSSDAPPRGAPGTPRSGQLLRRTFAGVFLGLVVYALMILWADLDSLRTAMADFPMALLPVAMGLSFANYLLRFLRWERYRSLLGLRLDRSTSFLIHLAGLSLTVTPGKMGEAFKSFLIRRVDGAPLARTAPIVVAERFTDLLGFLILVALGGIATAPEHSWVFWLTLGLCAVLLAVVSSERLGRGSCALLQRLPLVGGAAPALLEALDSARLLMTPRELLLPTLIATLGWGLECIAFWCVADALVPGQLPLLFAIYTFAFSAVAGAVLIVAPGGLGVTEGFLTFFTARRYQQMGMAAGAANAAAVSATVLIRLCTLWFAMGVGLLALWLFSRRYPDVTRPRATDVQGAP